MWALLLGPVSPKDGAVLPSRNLGPGRQAAVSGVWRKPSYRKPQVEHSHLVPTGDSLSMQLSPQGERLLPACLLPIPCKTAVLNPRRAINMGSTQEDVAYLILPMMAAPVSTKLRVSRKAQRQSFLWWVPTEPLISPL